MAEGNGETSKSKLFLALQFEKSYVRINKLNCISK